MHFNFPITYGTSPNYLWAFCITFILCHDNLTFLSVFNISVTVGLSLSSELDDFVASLPQPAKPIVKPIDAKAIAPFFKVFMIDHPFFFFTLSYQYFLQNFIY